MTAESNYVRLLRLLRFSITCGLAIVNQTFGGSSQPPTTAERAVIKSNRRVQFRQHSRKLGGAPEHLIDGSEKRICGLRFEFRVRMLLKSAVMIGLKDSRQFFSQ